MVVTGGDGQGRVNFEIALHAAELGHHVTLVASRIDDDVASDPRFRSIRLPDYKLPTNLLNTQVAAFYGGNWLHSHRAEFDIVQGNGSFTLSQTDVNTAHFVHGAWMKSPYHTSRIKTGIHSLFHSTVTRVHSLEESVAYRRSRIVIAVSDQVKRELVDIGVDPKKVRVIYNGVDCDEFHPGAEDRAALGLPTDRFLIMFAGDMSTPRKNLDSVLRAMQAFEDVHLVVVGSLRVNPYPEMAKALGLADRVSFLGFRLDMARVMRSVNAFIFPSRYDTFALVMLEAMASGLPVVTASTVGGAEVVAEANGTVLADPDDVEGLVAAMRALVADRERTNALATKSREVALNYSWRRMTAAYLDVYAEIAAEKTSTRTDLS
jgi:glycosyltransferase involved in cell wall biosynthesis